MKTSPAVPVKKTSKLCHNFKNLTFWNTLSLRGMLCSSFVMNNRSVPNQEIYRKCPERLYVPSIYVGMKIASRCESLTKILEHSHGWYIKKSDCG